MHDDGGLPQPLGPLARCGDEADAGLLADDDLDQGGGGNRVEEVQPEEAGRVGEFCGELRDRQRRRVRRDRGGLGDAPLDRAEGVHFELEVLWDRLDHEVCSSQELVVLGHGEAP